MFGGWYNASRLFAHLSFFSLQDTYGSCGRMDRSGWILLRITAANALTLRDDFLL